MKPAPQSSALQRWATAVDAHAEEIRTRRAAITNAHHKVRHDARPSRTQPTDTEIIRTSNQSHIDLARERLLDETIQMYEERMDRDPASGLYFDLAHSSDRIRAETEVDPAHPARVDERGRGRIRKVVDQLKAGIRRAGSIGRRGVIVTTLLTAMGGGTYKAYDRGMEIQMIEYTQRAEPPPAPLNVHLRAPVAGVWDYTKQSLEGILAAMERMEARDDSVRTLRRDDAPDAPSGPSVR